MEHRKIIHVDMDAFYASVEQRNNPSLKGKPVIVGGNPGSRGVVAACSYEARKYGIHSAMASSIAYRLCPHAIFIHGNFDEYHAVSEQIHEIFHDYTDLVEPMSLDEAYLDVTENKIGGPYATRIATEIRNRIFQRTRLTASAGVSYCKFLAKVASDYNKPDGLTVITPEQADGFIDRLPIGKFYGIGRVTEKRMVQLGIQTGHDLKKLSLDDLVSLFGKTGEYYYDIAHGIDERPVETDYVRKSIGKEETFERDIDDVGEMGRILKTIAGRVALALGHHETSGRTITLKVKFADFTSVSRSITLDDAINNTDMIHMHAVTLLGRTEAGIKKVRLLGISLSNLDAAETGDAERQLMLPFAM
ncbi:MAG TPA: DNA polymerase IV [Spirochaetota bacterium]|nr:DNA polymerase IV [Spirochaetota bacterium]HPC42754.1 DNA polymerase IV [Spirochaetota bacterium]HPL17390.1 DNA polymerase IV [Spirochaetota bacterium]HQF07611.1 DNA polymerase IV [Spirochaetota bacterium]HQH96342.1 DNA polymerase IV [Spirochaetota bacterium]